MTVVTAISEILNTNEIQVVSKPEEASSKDFSAVLKKKTFTLGDIKNTNKSQSNDKSDFKEFLAEVTSEANVETSLDLTLTKDIGKTIENLNSDELEENSIDENGIAVFAQTLQNTNNQITAELNTAEELATIESSQFEAAAIAESETCETIISKLESEKTDLDIKETILDKDALKELNIESIKAQTDTSGDNSSLLNHQSAEEQGIKIMLNQEIKAFELPLGEENQVNASQITSDKIIEQVTKHLENLQNTSKVSIVLNPESLGKVTIQLVKSPEGLSAQFTTITQEARNILMRGLDGLKDTLTTHGIGVDNVSVKISDAQKSEYNADWTEQEGSRGGNKEQNPQNKQEKEKGLFEKTIAQQKENGKV